ncbi:MAG: hypothetical protein AAF571_13775 [Verrucomicrobiota bacterium]
MSIPLGVSVYSDMKYICETTGSQKGHRQWRFGILTDKWYEPSPLEAYLLDNESSSLIHRWTSYSGTGHTIIGTPTFTGHGRPGAILLFGHATQKQWIESTPESDIMGLYALLVEGEEQRIQKEIAAILSDNEKRICP